MHKYRRATVDGWEAELQTCDRQRLGQHAEVKRKYPERSNPEDEALDARPHSGRSRGRGSPSGGHEAAHQAEPHQVQQRTHGAQEHRQSPDSFLLMINSFYFKNENIKKKNCPKTEKKLLKIHALY